MRMKWLLLLPLRIALTVVFVFLLWQSIVFLRPRPKPLTVQEVRAVKVACEEVAEQLTTKAAKPVRIGVAHLANDPTDVATGVLRDTLANRAGFHVQQGSPVQKFLKDVAHVVSEATTLEEVFNAGSRVELDVIVAGKLLAVDTTNGASQAALQIYAYDVRPGKWLVRDTITSVYCPSPAERAWDWCKGANLLTRFALWLVAVVALPWATLFATRWALEKKSNIASFIVVSAYTILAMALAVALAGPPGGRGYWTTMLAAFIVATAYNYWACERIAARDEG